ncbi:MAG: ATP-binding cassette domain-containing protein, partial [Casimicrobiaceae bacterium]
MTTVATCATTGRDLTVGGAASRSIVASAHALTRSYRVRRGILRAPGTLQAVRGISFTLDAGRTLAIVGESGCGKSTLARVVALLEPPTSGQLHLGTLDALAAS